MFSWGLHGWSSHSTPRPPQARDGRVCPGRPGATCLKIPISESPPAPSTAPPGTSAFPWGCQAPALGVRAQASRHLWVTAEERGVIGWGAFPGPGAGAPGAGGLRCPHCPHLPPGWNQGGARACHAHRHIHPLTLPADVVPTLTSRDRGLISTKNKHLG